MPELGWQQLWCLDLGLCLSPWSLSTWLAWASSQHGNFWIDRLLTRELRAPRANEVEAASLFWHGPGNWYSIISTIFYYSSRLAPTPRFKREGHWPHLLMEGMSKTLFSLVYHRLDENSKSHLIQPLYKCDLICFGSWKSPTHSWTIYGKWEPLVFWSSPFQFGVSQFLRNFFFTVREDLPHSNICSYVLVLVFGATKNTLPTFPHGTPYIWRQLSLRCWVSFSLSSSSPVSHHSCLGCHIIIFSPKSLLSSEQAPFPQGPLIVWCQVQNRKLIGQRKTDLFPPIHGTTHLLMYL